MSFKEVNALRKNRQLQEAYTMAKADMEKMADDWTRRAMFWVLYDMHKYSEKPEEKTELLRQMNEVYEGMVFDELIDNKLAYLNKMSSPDNKILSEANRLSREGKFEESIKLFQQASENSELDDSAKESYAWTLYKFIKEKQSTLREGEFDILAQRYFDLKIEKTHPTYRLFLIYAIKEYKLHTNFNIAGFASRWGIENLDDSDWEQTTKGEITYESLGHKLVNNVYEFINANSPKELSKLMPIVKTALEHEPKDFHLRRKFAILKAKEGDYDTAKSIYKNLIKEKSDWYLYDELSALETDEEIKLSLKIKALQKQKNDDFTCNVHLEAAEILIGKGKLSEAAYELKRYKDNRDKNQWKIGAKYAELAEKTANASIPENNNILYKEYAKKCDEYLYGKIERQYGYISYFNADKDMLHIIVKGNKEIFVRKNKLKVNEGQWYSFNLIKYESFGKERYKLAEIKKETLNEEIEQIMNVQTLEGELRHNGNYAFVNRVYIPGKVLKENNIDSNRQARVKAIKIGDKWKLVAKIDLA